MEMTAEFCTDSVLDYLRDNPDVVRVYLSDVSRRGIYPSYSDMLLRVSGTTREGVELNSYLVTRRVVTAWLRCEYARLYGIS